MSRPQFTGITVRDVAEHLAFETPFTAAEIMLRPRGAYRRELRLAAFWVAQQVCGLTVAGLGRAFGIKHSSAIELVGRCEFLREWDEAFRDLTDRVVAIFQASGPWIESERRAAMRAEAERSRGEPLIVAVLA